VPLSGVEEEPEMRKKVQLQSVAYFFLSSLVIGILVGTVVSDSAYAQGVGLWHFDEASGKDVKDSSGNGNHGEILGGKWVDGKIDKALEFDGTAKNGVFIKHKPNQDPAGMNEITVEAWVTLLSNPPEAQGNVMRKGIWVEGKPTTGWGLDVNQNLSVRGFVYIEAGSASLVDPNAPILELENWHHLAFTYDGKIVAVYVDGEEYGALDAKGRFEENDEDMAIGIRPDLTKPFPGIIDEVVVWSVARTQEEIKEDMNGVSFAVEAADKLATTWGTIRAQD